MNIVLLLMMASSSVVAGNDKSVNNYVPNAETAIKVAEAIWLPIYGESIYLKKPFVAKLIKGKYWQVIGTLSSEMEGGVPYVEIRKSDCKILKVYHTK